MLTFGSLLQKWRKRSGLKQVELAKASSIALITLSSYESGKRYPPSETVERLASLLGLNRDERELLIQLARKRQSSGYALPTPLSTCIGREALLDQVQTMLRHPGARLITLSGTAGVGKTRLAIEIAAQNQHLFPDGIAFIDLATMSQHHEVPAAILRILNPGVASEDVTWSGGEPLVTAADPSATASDPSRELLVRMIRDARMLLVLDTVEQIIGIEHFVLELLQQCPRLKLLLTSRRSMNLEGEQLVHVAGLHYPSHAQIPALPPAQLAQYPAVRLYIDLLRSRDRQFQFDSANCAAIVQICSAFDGIPLALELAAACFPVLTPQTLLARFHGWPDLLVQHAGVRPDRHWSLLKALQWSYDLLSPSVQWLLRHLAIFPGAFSLAIAEALIPAEHNEPGGPGAARLNHVELLRVLLQHNLVQYQVDAEGSAHYRLLTVVRDFALQHLDHCGERAEANRQLIRIALSMIEPAQSDPRSDGAALRPIRPKHEIELVEAACGIALHQHLFDDAAKISLVLSDWYMQLANWTAARHCFAALLEHRTAIERSLRLAMLRRAGLLARRQGAYAQAQELFLEYLRYNREDGDERQVAYALNMLGLIESAQGAYDTAEALYQDSLLRWQRLGSLRNEAAVLTNLATLASYRQQDDHAANLHQQALQVYQAMNDQRGVGRSLCNLGVVVLRQGSYRLAQSYFREGLALATHSDDPGFRALAHCNLGFCALFQGDIPEAEDYLRVSLREYQQLGDQRGIAYSLDGLAGVAALGGNGQRAALLFGAAERLRAQSDVQLPAVDHAMYQSFYAAARAQCGDTGYEAARIRGTVQPLALVINECGL